MWKKILLLFLFAMFVAIPCNAANEILTKVDTPQFVFADHGGDYIGGSGNNSLEIAGSTDVQLTTASLAAGAAVQSDKIDLGVKRANLYAVMMSLEMATDPVDGETVDLYWATSVDTSAAVGNPGGIVGSDTAYVGYSASDLDHGLKALTFIGSLILNVMNIADAVEIAFISVFSPQDRYGSLVVVNSSAGDNFHSDDVEFSVSFNPIVQEIQ